MISKFNIWARSFIIAFSILGVGAQSAPPAAESQSKAGGVLPPDLSSLLESPTSTVFPEASCNVHHAAQTLRTLVSAQQASVSSEITYDGNSPWRLEPAIYVSQTRNTFFKLDLKTNSSGRITRAEVEFKSLCSLASTTSLESAPIAIGAKPITDKDNRYGHLDIALRSMQGDGNQSILKANYPILRLQGFKDFNNKTFLVYVQILDRETQYGELKEVDRFFAVKP